jgi:hypothetical protein
VIERPEAAFQIWARWRESGFIAGCGNLPATVERVYAAGMATDVEPPASLKRQVKLALHEILQGNPALLREALEDIGLSRAIQEGRKTPPASRAQVFARLRGKRP